MPALYDISVPVFDAMLGNLSTLLERGAAHAAARNFDPQALLDARLSPDMFALTRQVQIACDAAKFGVARLAGVEAPKFDDSERTFDELRGRIEKTRTFIRSVPRASLDGAESRRVEVPVRTQTYAFDGPTFLMRWAFPNFYFHLVTAYDLLRHNGVEVGKRDYLGTVPQLG
jgi:hypothetical protein